VSKIMRALGRLWRMRRPFPAALDGSFGFLARLSAVGRCDRQMSRFSPERSFSGAKRASLAVRWRTSELQVEPHHGNLASALTFQSEEAALIEDCNPVQRKAFAWLITHYTKPIYSLLAALCRTVPTPLTSLRKSLSKSSGESGCFNGESFPADVDLSNCPAEASNQRPWWPSAKTAGDPHRAGDGARESSSRFS